MLAEAKASVSTDNEVYPSMSHAQARPPMLGPRYGYYTARATVLRREKSVDAQEPSHVYADSDPHQSSRQRQNVIVTSCQLFAFTLSSTASLVLQCAFPFT